MSSTSRTLAPLRDRPVRLLIGGTSDPGVRRSVGARTCARRTGFAIALFDWMGSMALRPIGLAAVGWIAASAGVSTTLLVASGLAFLLMLLPLSISGVRNLRWDVPVSA